MGKDFEKYCLKKPLFQSTCLLIKIEGLTGFGKTVFRSLNTGM